MSEFFEIISREFIYIRYYFVIQLRQIAGYWILGIIVGSLVSVFLKDSIHKAFDSIKDKKWGLLGLIPASLLGIASPLCMYGTIPIAASFSRQGMRQDWLAAFMMSSVLLNPQLIAYSTALGTKVLMIRLLSCFLCGISAGLAVHIFYREKPFFNFEDFEPSQNHDTNPNLFLRMLFNIGRNIKATGPWFLLGVLLSALFQRYVPQETFVSLFGEENEGFGILMAATIGVPLYACGGGTIPLIREWLLIGMSLGSAATFMITGPATKITNLGALKIVLEGKKFFVYILFVLTFSIITGFLVNILL